MYRVRAKSPITSYVFCGEGYGSRSKWRIVVIYTLEFHTVSGGA